MVIQIVELEQLINLMLTYEKVEEGEYGDNSRGAVNPLL